MNPRSIDELMLMKLACLFHQSRERASWLLDTDVERPKNGFGLGGAEVLDYLFDILLTKLKGWVCSRLT